MKRIVVDNYGTTCTILNARGLRIGNIVSRATRKHEQEWEARRAEDNELIRLGQLLPLSWRQAVKDWGV
jgi:hypothetical protein